jgi:hypothetical protein
MGCLRGLLFLLVVFVAWGTLTYNRTTVLGFTYVHNPICIYLSVHIAQGKGCWCDQEMIHSKLILDILGTHATHAHAYIYTTYTFVQYVLTVKWGVL